MPIGAAMELDAMTQALLMTTHDHAEFHAAFNEKRPPELDRPMTPAPAGSRWSPAPRRASAPRARSRCPRPVTGSRWSPATPPHWRTVAAALPGESLVLPTDVLDPAALEPAFARVESAWGPVEVLVVNAGAAMSAPLVRTSDEDWQRMLDLNLTAPFRCLRRALPVDDRRPDGAGSW